MDRSGTLSALLVALCLCGISATASADYRVIIRLLGQDAAATETAALEQAGLIDREAMRQVKKQLNAYQEERAKIDPRGHRLI